MPMLWFEENGYIDGPILTTFHTNLVILPAVMEYTQYIFIALGLVTTIVAALVYYKVKRRTCEGDRSPRENTSTSTGERTPLLQVKQH